MPNSSPKTKFSGANGDRDMVILPVQLTTSRIGNLIRLILTLAICDDNTYILQYYIKSIKTVALLTIILRQYVWGTRSSMLDWALDAGLGPRCWTVIW